MTRKRNPDLEDRDWYGKVSTVLLDQQAEIKRLQKDVVVWEKIADDFQAKWMKLLEIQHNSGDNAEVARQVRLMVTDYQNAPKTEEKRRTEMKLYLLKCREDHCIFDSAQGFVVRASSPANARKTAACRSGDEGIEFWLDPEKANCQRLTEDGPTEVILRDFAAG